VEEMIKWVDRQYFSELAAAVPEHICRNNRAVYDTASGIYSVSLWNETYAVDPKQQTIVTSPADFVPQEYFPVFLMYYLLHTDDNRPGTDWISEKDLPGGATFFRGPHLIPTALISKTFANNLQAFIDSCHALNGEPLQLADAAFKFQITPEIPVVILYWIGDEDFPAEAKMLFDRSMIDFMPLDIVFALAVEVCDRFRRLAEE
jgi:hypothetical protein